MGAQGGLGWTISQGPFSSEAGTVKANGQCRVRGERKERRERERILWAAAIGEDFLKEGGLT